MIETGKDAHRRLPPFVGGVIGGGGAWASAEVLLGEYTDLLHVAVALAGLGAGWLIGLAIAAGVNGSN